MENFLFEFGIGDFTCLAISDGVEWNQNLLLVRTDQHTVLIDAGNGDTTTPAGRLCERLEASGISPTAIDRVILSHGDVDHIGGTMDARGKFMFPTARYILARDEWAFWRSKVKRAPATMSAQLGEEFTQRIETFPRVRLPQLGDRLDLIDADSKIVPGIRTIAAPGHTPGMMVIAVSSRREQLTFISDVLYESDLTLDGCSGPAPIGNPEWHAAVDVAPDQALHSRDRLFEQAAREQSLLMTAHLPHPGLGYVSTLGQGWGWSALETRA